MSETLVYGWRTAVLSVALVEVVVLTISLARQIRNRAANRSLASLLIVLSGMITPWMIGFAGFYDKWPWLSFAPFAISLAIAPLAWFYMYALVHGRLPDRPWWHMAPACVQFLYLSAAFLLLHQPDKNVWLDRSALFYNLVTGIGVVGGLTGYGIAGRLLIGRYGNWLSRQRSDDHRFALTWLGRAVGALFLLMAIWATYAVYDLIEPLSYSGLMGLYVAIAAIALFLGIEGWRHAPLPFPVLTDTESQAPPITDWITRASNWADRVRAERLYADPELSVPRLARILGTNSAYISRAFNEGLGQNFSAFINRLRCEEVAARLRNGTDEDLLDLALDSGFSSKASFNRAFQAAFGRAPSTYRKAHASNQK